MILFIIDKEVFYSYLYPVLAIAILVILISLASYYYVKKYFYEIGFSFSTYFAFQFYEFYLLFIIRKNKDKKASENADIFLRNSLILKILYRTMILGTTYYFDINIFFFLFIIFAPFIIIDVIFIILSLKSSTAGV